MTTDEISLEAFHLFRVVQGKGDDGSIGAYLRQSPAGIEGWEKLAKHVLRRIERASEPERPRSEHC